MYSCIVKGLREKGLKRELGFRQPIDYSGHGDRIRALFLGHLWDVMLWVWGSGGTASFRQAARHGGVVVRLCW